MLTDAELRLQRVSKLEKKLLKLLAEGVDLERALARKLDDSMEQTVADRLTLADEFLAMGKELASVKNPVDMTRPAIARFYYAIYHAMRAVAYHAHDGDDYENHGKLASGIPDDYPDVQVVRNAINDARSMRNEADYEPYPKAAAHFHDLLVAIHPSAVDIVAGARTYLQAKGNRYA